jgi:hypothetical protein
MRSVALVIVLAACSSDPKNAAGDYSVMVTNHDNGCNFMSWTPDDTSDATLTLTQSSNHVTANVTDLSAVILDLALGGHAYAGEINDGDLDLNLFGVRSNTTGNCTYTFNSEIRAVLDGDALSGRIDYVSATNNNPDCVGIMDCRSFQSFDGSRSPR